VQITKNANEQTETQKTKPKQKKNIAFTILYQCNVSQSIVFVSLNFRIEYRKLNASVNKNDATNGIHIL